MSLPTTLTPLSSWFSCCCLRRPGVGRKPCLCLSFAGRLGLICRCHSKIFSTPFLTGFRSRTVLSSLCVLDSCYSYSLLNQTFLMTPWQMYSIRALHIRALFLPTIYPTVRMSPDVAGNSFNKCLFSAISPTAGCFFFFFYLHTAHHEVIVSYFRCSHGPFFPSFLSGKLHSWCTVCASVRVG